MKKLVPQSPLGRIPWLSMLLLFLANMTFGVFVHEYTRSSWVWAAAIAYIVLECGVLTIGWKQTRDFVLLGFQSDVGYTLMAVAAASFAVVLVVWVRISGHFLVMLAAALLLRVRLYTGRGNSAIAFITMLSISLLGLGISWLIAMTAPDFLT